MEDTETIDELYRKSMNGDKFANLMDLILSRENILLAYRNIKTNTGSNTAGTDKLTIKDIGCLSAEEVVKRTRFIVQGSKHGYRPKPVRINTALMLQLMRSVCYVESVEYADNRISLFSAQWGKCAVSDREFQTTDEIACAELELWNKTFGRWVNRGASGIALFEPRGTYTGLRYVFDVSDTHGKDNFRLWEAKPAYADDVTDALEAKFGELDDDSDLVHAVMSACRNAAQDNVTDYLTDLAIMAADGGLNGMDEDALREQFLPLLESSIAYSVLTRLGYDANLLISPERFDNVTLFDTTDTVNTLGRAVSDISEMCLRQIERTVRDCERGNRTFDTSPETGYNEAGNQNTAA